MEKLETIHLDPWFLHPGQFHSRWQMRYLFLALRMLQLRPKLDRFRRCGSASIVGVLLPLTVDVQAEQVDSAKWGEVPSLMISGGHKPIGFGYSMRRSWLGASASCATAAMTSSQAMKPAIQCIDWSLQYRTC